MYAYGTKYTNCECLYLIYPKDDEVEAIGYNYYTHKSVWDLPLKVLFFDLEKNVLDNLISL
jgi:5-methylcytosine-specific restriction enzyme subunit McrC